MDENKFNTNAPAPQRSLLGKILNVVLCVFLVIALAFLAVRIIFRPVYVNGHSMDETLFDGEAVAIGAFDKNVKTGDIVVANNAQPGEEQNLIIKRVAATGGDKIVFVLSDGVIEFYRNDWTQPVSETYIKEPMKNISQFAYAGVAPSVEEIDDYIIELDADEVFLMGDNRNASTDSRYFGAVKKSAIVGKMVFVISGDSFLETIFCV